MHTWTHTPRPVVHLRVNSWSEGPTHMLCHHGCPLTVRSVGWRGIARTGDTTDAPRVLKLTA